MKLYKLVKKKKIKSVTSKLLKNKSDEIISKVIYTGICGSDLSVYLAIISKSTSCLRS